MTDPTSKPLLRPGETAVAGQATPQGQVTLWDAVFAIDESNTHRLIAYVDGADIAEFFATCLNERQQG